MEPDSDSFITASQMRRQRMGAGISFIMGKLGQASIVVHNVVDNVVVDDRVVDLLDHGGVVERLVVLS